MKRLLLVPGLALLSACATNEYSDLNLFMKTAEQSMSHQIEPLPEVKPYAPFTYSAFDLPDPFKPRKLQQDELKRDTSAFAPDLNRRKEPLEAYPLESIKMVGVWQEQRQTYALVKVENTIFSVKVGNHLGQDYGLITTISEAEVKLKEQVQDSGGDWSERISMLHLSEVQESKK
jgi:type IV pilus assembly protein PilP